MHQPAGQKAKAVQMPVHRQNDLWRGDLTLWGLRDPIRPGAFKRGDGAVFEYPDPLAAQPLRHLAHKKGRLNHRRSGGEQTALVIGNAGQIGHRLRVQQLVRFIHPRKMAGKIQIMPVPLVRCGPVYLAALVERLGGQTEFGGHLCGKGNPPAVVLRLGQIAVQRAAIVV